MSPRDTRTRISVAMDASEDAKFLGLVMGYAADIQHLHKDVCSSAEIKRIHMSRMNRLKRRRVLEEISKKASPSIRMHCLTVDRQRQLSVFSGSRIAGHRLRQVTDYFIWFEVKKQIMSSCDYLHASLHDLSIEVDSDSERLVKGSGMRTVQPSLAHELADAVAWSNHARFQVNGLRHVDLVRLIGERIRKRFHI